MGKDIFHRICLHVVWATRGRLPMLESADQRQMAQRDIVDAATRFGGHVLAANAMPDHAHLLVCVPPIDLARYVGKVKGASSYAMNARCGTGTLAWQDGYGILSVRADDTGATIRYIEDQEAIHASRREWTLWESTDAGPD